MQNDEIEIPQI